MRRRLTITGFAGLAAATAALLLAAPAGAQQPLPKGAYYGGHSGSLRPITSHCPIAPPPGTTTTDIICGHLNGPFTVSATGGKKLTGSYVANLATGDTDTTGTGTCEFTSAAFTFTVGKGNTFQAVTPSTLTSEPNRNCVLELGPSFGPHDRMALTTIFNLTITHGTGRFKGLTGEVGEDGAIVPNVDPTGTNTRNGRIIGNFSMLFGVA